MRQDVRFFGFVPHRTLAALYRMAAVFAFPSLYEGFGLPPLEAMACGTPVVTSRISSLPEVVGDGAAARRPLQRGGDRAGDRARPRRRRRCARGLVERGPARGPRSFSWERSVRAIHAGLHEGARPARARRPRRPRAEGRPRPRLADRDARRREGAPLARPPLPGRADLHAAPRAGLGRARARGARDPHLVRAAPARRRDAATATTCRSSPPRRESLRPRAASTSCSRARTAWPRACAPRPGAVHLCYCHTPMRYVWDRYDDYFGPGRASPPRAPRRSGRSPARPARLGRAHRRPRPPLRRQQRLRGRPHPPLLRPRRRS